jgi:hypothetical protein
MCEPQSCEPTATTGGPLRQTCYGLRTDAHLVCNNDEGATQTLGVGANPLCSALRVALPPFCKVDTACFTFNCKTPLFGVDITLSAELALCETPVAITFTFDVDPLPPFYWEVTAEKKWHVPIPGLDFNVPGLPMSAGAFAVADLEGSSGTFNISIGIDACAEIDLPIPGHPVTGQECGSDISSDLPLYFLGPWTFDFTSACADRPPAPEPEPPGEELVHSPVCQVFGAGSKATCVAGLSGAVAALLLGCCCVSFLSYRRGKRIGSQFAEREYTDVGNTRTGTEERRRHPGVTPRAGWQTPGMQQANSAHAV